MTKYLDALAKAQQERESKRPPYRDRPAPDQPRPGSAGETASPRLPASVDPSVASQRILSEKLVCAHDIQSPITEQLRQIRTNLETVLAEHLSKLILVSSPIAGDGKTLVTSNLAVVFADNPDEHVLVVDADMRKPELHRMFDVRSLTPGLSEYLSGQAVLDEVIRPTVLPNLKVIPAGRRPEKPTVLLGGERMAHLRAELNERFQWVLFDTPPLLPVSDASVLGQECVGTILVVRMGHTHRSVINRAQEHLAELRLPVLGCILNDFASLGRDNDYYYKYYAKKNTGNAG